MITASVIARPDTFAVVCRASLDHVRRSRTQNGYLLHSRQVDCAHPPQPFFSAFFHEEWRDPATRRADGERPGSPVLLGAARALGAAREPIGVHDAACVRLG